MRYFCSVFTDIGRINRRSFLSVFDVNRDILGRYARKNDFIFSSPTTLSFDLLTSNLFFQLSLLDVSPSSLKFLCLTDFQWIVTNRQTDGLQHLIRPRRESRLITVLWCRPNRWQSSLNVTDSACQTMHRRTTRHVAFNVCCVFSHRVNERRPDDYRLPYNFTRYTLTISMAMFSRGHNWRYIRNTVVHQKHVNVAANVWQ